MPDEPMPARNRNTFRSPTMPSRQTAVIYDALAQHQKTDLDWGYRECLVMLHMWAKRFALEFKLEIPAISLGVERLGKGRLGQFRSGHNSLGLQGEILIDEDHLSANISEDRWWDVLGTLFHELLHGWQQAHGKESKGNYHNMQFRRKAADYGLIISASGVTDYDPDGPFFDLLARYDVIVPRLPQPKYYHPRGESKLKLWMCSCPIRVRVAVPHFAATCETCRCRFERVG